MWHAFQKGIVNMMKKSGRKDAIEGKDRKPFMALKGKVFPTGKPSKRHIQAYHEGYTSALKKQ